MWVTDAPKEVRRKEPIAPEHGFHPFRDILIVKGRQQVVSRKGNCILILIRVKASVLKEVTYTVVESTVR